MSASKLAEAYVELRTDGESRVQAGLRRVRTDTEKTHAKMLAMKNLARGVFLGIAGAAGIGFSLQALIGFFKKSIEKAEESEKAQAKLRATLRATGNEVEGNATKLNKLAGALAETTMTGRSTTLALVSLGLNLGVGIDQVGEMTKEAIGLSEAIGVDATSAMEMLAKATQGNFKALEKALPTVRNAAGAEAKLAAVQKVANQGLKEREALTHTLAGATEELERALGGLERSVGEALTPALIAMSKFGTEAFRALTAGTLENEVFVLELTKRVYGLANAWIRMQTLGIAGLKDYAQTIDYLDKQINTVTNDRIRADNNAANQKAGNLKMVGDAAKKAAHSVNDFFEENNKLAEQNPEVIAALKEQEKAEHDRGAQTQAARDRNEANRPKNMPKPAREEVTPEQAADVRKRNDDRRTKAVMDAADRTTRAVAATIKPSGSANFQSDYYRKKYGANFDYGRGLSEKVLDTVTANANVKKARDVAGAGGGVSDYLKTKSAPDDPIVTELKKLNQKLPAKATYGP